MGAETSVDENKVTPNAVPAPARVNFNRTFGSVSRVAKNTAAPAAVPGVVGEAGFEDRDVRDEPRLLLLLSC